MAIIPKITFLNHLFLAALCAHLARGHVVLENPRPFKFPAYGPSNPLEPSGLDWPCKIPAGHQGIEIDGEPTLIQIGQSQTASFTGLATHGGGSCQFSLLPGHSPSKDNDDFRVIKSIEGGCPVASEALNIQAGKPNSFDWTLPSDLEPGEYTWAWTWQSRTTGEVYMNCAPITAVAGKQTRLERFKPAERVDRRGLSELPPVFIADLGSATGDCHTGNKKAQQAVKYPEPGLVVEHPEGTGRLLQPTCNGNRHAGSGSVPSG
ncbi:endoglucanase [Glarea lozoyensis ATCC 20868]|uniref:Endoglucanase n=1 Tax=Glarea lozoyensis (strain ATCC 20868 / MF5171) TaxID=1116229 RepID=S3DIK9_GLAL2|nr:endoglucanase [Glarea lozoyensis ATCC 20868]EPE26388.1 endoglucanase [Glarea lozoyensis ATCC 20868]